MADREIIDRLLECARGLRVLVVGDVMVDEYVCGTVDRLSPEAPVPVLNVVERSIGPGGAANVASQLVALEASVFLVGRIGSDEGAGQLLGVCEHTGIDASGLLVDTATPTTRKQRAMAGRQQLLRLDTETTAPLLQQLCSGIVDHLYAIEPPDIVIISDYAKGVVTAEIARQVIERSRQWSVPVLVDSKSSDIDRFSGASMVKINRREFEALDRDGSPSPIGDLGWRVGRLCLAMGVERLVVTLGEEGMVVADDDSVLTVPAPRLEQVYDVSGAGDTVMAILAVGLCADVPIEDVARVANMVAGIAIRRVGATAVTPNEVRAESTLGVQPVLTVADLVERAGRWRRDNRSIVFTNGCFDLLHPGHVHLLRSAAEFGDVLVVGINSDESLRALKGPNRPVIGEADRAAMVAAIGGVDAVVIFDELDPIALIEVLRPDVLVKGADYRIEDIVGYEEVRAYGGNVETIPLLEEWSTTVTVDRIRGDGTPLGGDL